MAKKKLTKAEKLQRQYNSQIKRIEKRLEQLQQEGYASWEYSIREVKHPTEKTIERLRKVTPKLLRSKLRVYDIETGEVARTKKDKECILRNNAEHAIENVQTVDSDSGAPLKLDISLPQETEQKPKKKKKQTISPTVLNGEQIVIDNFLNQMQSANWKVFQAINSAVSDAIKQNGRGAVAEYLQNLPDTIKDKIANAKDWYDEEVQNFDGEILHYIPSMSDEQRQQAEDDLDAYGYEDGEF